MSDLFKPMPGQGTTLAAYTTSGSTTLAKGSASFWVYNAGPDVVCLRWGTGTQTAVSDSSVGDMTIGSGMGMTLGKALSDDTLAAICPTSTATLYVISGSGE